MGHRPPLRQEDVLDRPVEAAGATQPRHIPASLDDRRLLARKHPAPVQRTTIRAAARLAVIEYLKAAQHPGAFLTTAAEAPAPADSVAALDRYRLSAALYRGACDHGVGTVRIDLVDTIIRQTQRNQLADAVVSQFQPTEPAPSARTSTTRR